MKFSYYGYEAYFRKNQNFSISTLFIRPVRSETRDSTDTTQNNFVE